MGRLTADVAQRMLTYEAVLDLPVTEITLADYRNRDGVQCIYVETAMDDDGYNDRYWVSVASGLLFAAERCCEGEVIYRFTTVEPEGDIPEESLFLLPDGSALMPEA